MSIREIVRSPDRLTLVDRYLPPIAARGGRILWVGCQAYTADYPAWLAAGGGEVWTMDFDADAAKWGRKDFHRTGDLKEVQALFADMTFDTILCNGVLGFGVDSPEDQEAALAAIAKALRPGGLLLLGWNTDRIADPVVAGFAQQAYRQISLDDLPTRMTFPIGTHVFDLLERVDFAAPRC